MGIMINGRKVDFEDGRSVWLGKYEKGWIVRFLRPAREGEGDKEVETKISLSDEAMSALSCLYTGYFEFPPENG
jgi:hypothetical protein